MTAILEISGLSHSYGRREVLSDLKLTVNEGEIVGLLGPNGAGKTTAFKLIAGILKQRCGRILLDGSPLGGPLWQRARNGLGYVPQAPSVVPAMSVEDNVALGQRTRDGDRLSAILEKFGLSALSAAPAGTLSGGERRRVELARAFASEARLLLVDEPFAALDPKTVNEVSESLKTTAQAGVGVLLTDHYIAQTLYLCHRIYILKDGHVLCSGSTESVAQDPKVRETYLGADFFR